VSSTTTGDVYTIPEVPEEEEDYSPLGADGVSRRRIAGDIRDEYMFNDVHPDAHRDRQQHFNSSSVLSPPGLHPHASSAKPNNAFFNVSPSNSPTHDEIRQSHNDSYLNRKQMLSPKSSQISYHPSKHNGSSHSESRHNEMSIRQKRAELEGSYQRSKFTTTTGKSVELRKPEHKNSGSHHTTQRGKSSASDRHEQILTPILDMSPTKERIIDQRKLRKAKSQKYRQQ
jgi:hypothetical protein